MQGEDNIYLRESLINMDGRMEFASSSQEWKGKKIE